MKGGIPDGLGWRLVFVVLDGIFVVESSGSSKDKESGGVDYVCVGMVMQVSRASGRWADPVCWQ